MKRTIIPLISLILGFVGGYLVCHYSAVPLPLQIAMDAFTSSKEIIENHRILTEYRVETNTLETSVKKLKERADSAEKSAAVYSRKVQEMTTKLANYEHVKDQVESVATSLDQRVKFLPEPCQVPISQAIATLEDSGNYIKEIEKQRVFLLREIQEKDTVIDSLKQAIELETEKFNKADVTIKKIIKRKFRIGPGFFAGYGASVNGSPGVIYGAGITINWS